MQNKKILILGATGQIGKELSLILNENKEISVTCHARTKVSAAFLLEKKIDCVICPTKSEMLKKEINNSDLIFDLAAPNSGSLNEIKNFYKERFNFIINNMKAKTKFVFASTMNAYGISEKNNKLKNYFFPSSIYAANKRYAEKYSAKLAKKNSIEIFLVRLSEVHGVYQRASQNLKKLILDDYVFEIPKTPAWIVFISTIEKMLINILYNKEKPGLYTLTTDAIFWKDLLEHLSKKINSNIKYKFVENTKISFKEKFFTLLNKYILTKKDFIRGNFPVPKIVEEIKKLEYRISKAKNAFKKLNGTKIYRELNKYTGVLPGKRFKLLTLDKDSIFKKDDNNEKKFNQNFS